LPSRKQIADSPADHQDFPPQDGVPSVHTCECSLPLDPAKVGVDERARRGGRCIQMACNGEGPDDRVLTAAHAYSDDGIITQHSLDVGSERGRMRLLTAIQKRRLRSRNISERQERAHGVRHSGYLGYLLLKRGQ
jgi:hypothetical protein